MPASTARVLALLSSPDASFNAVAAAVLADPALAAEVLRIANTAAYKRATPAADIGDAVRRLGMLELRDMTGAMAMLGAFANPGELSLRIQETSVLSANLAVMAAAELADPSPRRAFLCGLLCEIGALACLAVDGPAYVEMRRECGHDVARLRVAEQERYGASSTQIGATILRKNGIPDAIVAPIEGLQDADVRLVCATRFARQAAPIVLDASVSPWPEWPDEVAEVGRALGFDLSVDDMRSKVVEAVDDTNGQLSFAQAS